MGRHEESSSLLEEVHSQHPTDDASLQAMAICYREMQKREAATHLKGLEEFHFHLCILEIYHEYCYHRAQAKFFLFILLELRIQSQRIKHQSSVLVRQKLGRTNMFSMIVYVKLREKSVKVWQDCNP